MKKRVTRTLAAPTQDQIAACAHLIWEKEGRPQGQEVEYWYQAEAQLKATYEHEMRQMRQQQTKIQLPP